MAGLFAWRCIVPGAQFYYYWKSAKENAAGLSAMNSASYEGITPEQELTSLATAMAEFKMAIKDNPTFATSYYKLGHIYNRIGVLTNDPVYSQLAIDTYEDLDDVNANYSEVHLNLGIMYAQKAGSVTESKNLLQQDLAALQAQIPSATGETLDRLQSEYGEKKEALKTLEGSEDKVRFRLMQKAFDEMTMAAHQSLKSNTQYLAGSIGREPAQMYEQQGDTEKANQIKEKAKKYFRSIIEYTPTLEALQAAHKQDYQKAQKSLLTLAEETNNMDEMIAVLKQMVHDNPDSDLMLRALLQSYDRAGKAKEKLAYLENAVHADPTDARLREELAAAYKAAGEKKKYINELRRVEVLKPQDPALLKELYHAFTEQNDAAHASQYADKLSSYGLSLSEEATSPTAPEAAQTTAPATAKAPEAAQTTAPATAKVPEAARTAGKGKGKNNNGNRSDISDAPGNANTSDDAEDDGNSFGHNGKSLTWRISPGQGVHSVSSGGCQSEHMVVHARVDFVDPVVVEVSQRDVRQHVVAIARDERGVGINLPPVQDLAVVRRNYQLSVCQ